LSEIEKIRELGSRLSFYLRPRTFPLAIKFVKSGESIPEKAYRPSARFVFCRTMLLSRRTGRSYVIGKENIPCLGVVMLGLANYSKDVWEESKKMLIKDFLVGWRFYKSEEIAEKVINIVEEDSLPPGSFTDVIVSPIERTIIKPDIVVVYGDGAQINRLVSGVAYADEETPFIEAKLTSLAGCRALSKCYKTRKAQFILPGYGERYQGFTGDDEVAVVFHIEALPKIVEGLEYTFRGGLRYPTPYMVEYSSPAPEPEEKAIKKLLGKA